VFTGIVHSACPVAAVAHGDGLVRLGVALPPELRANLHPGASVSVDGVCLTVTALADAVVSFDVILETLNKSTLGSLKVGDRVNMERSARHGDEIGGHDVSGHVDGTAEVVEVATPGDNHVVTFQVSPAMVGYIFPKGFIAVNGASLTVAEVDRDRCHFRVWLIPETLRRTTFGGKRPGDRVNIELDRQTQVIVDTVRAYLQTLVSSGQFPPRDQSR
jgi:riboflavin synthase